MSVQQCDMNLCSLTEYLFRYIRPKISPRLTYVTEKGEGNTKDGRDAGGVQRRILSVCATIGRSSPSFIRVADRPAAIFCNGQRNSEVFCYKKNSVVLVRKRTIRPSDRSLPAKLVPTLADRGCRVVSATDPHGRNLGFFDPEPLLFHSSSSSIILTRLSGPRSRPTSSQKIW
jgi:hypothetical protein